MKEDERAVWAGLAVILTGITVALTALRHGDLKTCDNVLATTAKTAVGWAAKLHELVGPNPPGAEKADQPGSPT